MTRGAGSRSREKDFRFAATVEPMNRAAAGARQARQESRVGIGRRRDRRDLAAGLEVAAWIDGHHAVAEHQAGVRFGRFEFLKDREAGRAPVENTAQDSRDFTAERHAERARHCC